MGMAASCAPRERREQHARNIFRNISDLNAFAIVRLRAIVWREQHIAKGIRTKLEIESGKRRASEPQCLARACKKATCVKFRKSIVGSG